MTSADLIKSEFCKQFQCIPSAPYRDQNGDEAVLYRLNKDPLNLDLLSTLKNGSLNKLTFKFASEEVLDKKIVTSLIASLIGKNTDSAEIEKLIAGAKIKTTRAQLASAEKLKVGELNISVGKVLKQPTFQIDLQ